MGLRRIACCAVGAVLAFGGTACTSQEPGPSNPVVQPGKPGEANHTLSPEEIESGVPVVPPNAADFGYAEMMIVHHHQAVEMSALAPDRAANASLKGLASRIADTQDPEIGAMNEWLRRNGKPTVDPSHAGHGGHAGHQMPGMATPEQLAELKAATGPAFDELFVRLMTRHHEGAIEMANVVRKDGSDVKVQEMADNIVAEQSDEIRRMSTILAG
ncbi:DUF305 domain-containing protein [Actinokineospora globicatena]|uniref:DUF305 domain-containing protein n=1 Tax=Actinokineospora globicatena TaxID=103729 RepID=UPI0020A23CBA|nr:DUF305 domain-containing protein [Actinokineospora globicatena]MCP2304173.1 Uncharacterized conserved protein, DUF305 family [Actinokineospora globicatena]GLW78469.1 lipoprotein [Actinokineospora globicatena]GLW84867.1 lipoprotein [Actinokineospora globicatena]